MHFVFTRNFQIYGQSTNVVTVMYIILVMLFKLVFS